MSHSGRPTWRLFCWALCLVLVAHRASSQTPQLTTVSDTVYRADGSPAAGTLPISWPAFTSAGVRPLLPEARVWPWEPMEA
jgi:hypothetical protein